MPKKQGITSWTCVFVLFVLIQTIGTVSVNIVYIFIQNNSLWNQNQQSFSVTSLLQCSTKCSELATVCGFNYIRPTETNGVVSKTCHCVLQSDLDPNGGHVTSDGSTVYIRENCTTAYQAAVSPTTTSTTTTTTSTTTTTTTTTTPLPTTTTPQPCPSTVDALVCTNTNALVYIDNQFLTYAPYTNLTVGPDQVQTVSSTFPEVSTPIVAGYNDGTYIFLVKGGDTWKYSQNPITFVSTESSASLFGTSGTSGDSEESSESDLGATTPASVVNFDAVLKSGSQLYLFQGTTLTVMESGSVVSTVSLTSNLSNNPYTSINHSGRPQSIIAGCVLDGDRHVFISENSVYLFTHSTQTWSNLGSFVCS